MGGGLVWVWVSIGSNVGAVFCLTLVRSRILAMNSDILIVNYGIKQSQFTKPTQSASDPEESNKAFDRAIREWLL